MVSLTRICARAFIVGGLIITASSASTLASTCGSSPTSNLLGGTTGRVLAANNCINQKTQSVNSKVSNTRQSVSSTTRSITNAPSAMTKSATQSVNQATTVPTTRSAGVNSLIGN